jgi:hypothetical protein
MWTSGVGRRPLLRCFVPFRARSSTSLPFTSSTTCPRRASEYRIVTTAESLGSISLPVRSETRTTLRAIAILSRRSQECTTRIEISTGEGVPPPAGVTEERPDSSPRRVRREIRPCWTRTLLHLMRSRASGCARRGARSLGAPVWSGWSLTRQTRLLRLKARRGYLFHRCSEQGSWLYCGRVSAALEVSIPAFECERDTEQRGGDPP